VRGLIYDISYISLYVRRRISVGSVLEYNVSGGRIRLSTRLFDTLGIGGVMTRVFGGSTELSTELSTGSHNFQQNYRRVSERRTVLQNERGNGRTSTNHRVNRSWMESVYVMIIRDSGLIWIMVHISPGLGIISTRSGDTFVMILCVGYDGGRAAWILLV